MRQLPKPLACAAGATETALISWLNEKQSTRRVRTDAAPGQRLLTWLEEELVAHWVIANAEADNPAERDDVFQHVRTVLQRRPGVSEEERQSTEKRDLTRWYRGFLKRQPSISQWIDDGIYNRRTAEEKRAVIDHFFGLLASVATDLPAAQIYAAGEVRLCGDGTCRDLDLAPRLSRREKAPGRRATAHLDVMHIGNAAGVSLPPVVVWEGARMTRQHTDGHLPGTLIAMQQDGEFIAPYFTSLMEHLVKHAGAARPLVLILDGAVSDIDMPGFYYSEQQRIHVLVLPDRCTHQLQVADAAVFGPFKRRWQELWQQHLKRDVDGDKRWHLNCGRLTSTMVEAWTESITPERVISGFLKTGMYPFDRQAWKAIDEERRAVALGGMPMLITLRKPAEKPTEPTEAAEPVADEQ